MAALARQLIGGYLPIQAEGNIKANKFAVEAKLTVGPPAADSNAWAGVPDVDIADEADGYIAIDGIVNLVLNEAVVAIGSELMIDVTADHEGEAILATTGKQVCAIAVQLGADGDTIAARLCRYIKP